jgi:hypothetical protein
VTLRAAAALAVLVVAAAAPSPAAAITIAWVGDTVLGSRYGNPPDRAGHVFDGVRADLRDADLTTGNLEGTFSAGGASKCGARRAANCFAFQAPPENAGALADAGFDVMSLANNHAFDFGPPGRRQTIAALDGVHVDHAGLPGAITYEQRQDLRVAFVGFAPYPWATSLLDLPGARRVVEKASRSADVVVAMIHAGAEGADRAHTPRGTESAFGENRGWARRFAHTVVDAGADLVLGSGPHVLRGLERYRGRMIAYSLGNFAGFRNFGLGGRLSLSGILHVTLGDDGRFLDGRWTSIRLVGPGLPRRDPSHASPRLVRSLSRADFRRSFHFAADGAITAG